MSEEGPLLATALSLSKPENYTQQDRYRDFRKVFFGTEEGKRVLHELLSWGHMFKPSPSTSPVDPYAMAIREGERNIALRLLTTVSVEPVQQPATTTRRKGET